MKKANCCEKKGSGLKCAIAGAGAGLAVGAIGMVLLSSNKRTLKKKANKVADAMENLFDSAKDMFQ